MVQKSKKKEVQHYIPKLLLEGFANPGEKNSDEFFIHVFNKTNDKKFYTNIDNVGAEKDFYDFINDDDEKTSLEPLLTDIEEKMRKIINVIITQKSLALISEEDRKLVELFVIFQYLRVRKQREVLKNISNIIKNRIIEMGHRPKEAIGWKEYNETLDKPNILGILLYTAKRFLPIFSNKSFVLFKSKSKLYISDQPVVMSNDNDYGAYGNIGLAMSGIEIYMPINSEFAIGFLCPSIMDTAKDSLEQLANIIRQCHSKINSGMADNNTYELLGKCNIELKKANDFIKIVTNGSYFDCDQSSTNFLNHLQVIWSHRFVMCQNGDFELLTNMIKNNESIRNGIQPSSEG